MNIQISVILWTVICFFLLMLILHNLLFKPLLDCMDSRRKRVSDAEKKQKKDREKEQEAAALMEKSLNEQMTRAKTDAERKVAEEQIRTEQTISGLLAKEQDACRAYQETLDAEKQAFEVQKEAAAKRLGEKFVSKFVS